jgi:alkylation response protein AidB-like acyl-CoA dehydrogenase
MKIFNEQHQMFRQAVRSFVEREVEPHIDEWEEAGQIPKSVWPRMGALGFLGVEYDEKYGGGGADFLTTAVLCEEAARSRCAAFAMALGVQTDMASPHLYWTGSEALKEKYLPGICRGESLTAIAVTEPGGGTDVIGGMRTSGRRTDGGWIVNGNKTWCTAAHTAHYILLLLRTDDTVEKRHQGLSLFLVPTDAEGVTQHSNRRSVPQHCRQAALDRAAANPSNKVVKVHSGLYRPDSQRQALVWFNRRQGSRHTCQTHRGHAVDGRRSASSRRVGSALTGIRSPSPVIISASTLRTKSGAFAGTGG